MKDADIVAPSIIHAETVLLGAVMLDNQAWGEIRESLKGSDFFLDSHRKIARAMKYLADNSCAIDIVTLTELLSRWQDTNSRNTWLVEIGGVATIAALTEGLPRRPAIEDYIRLIRDKSLLRKTIAVCRTVMDRAQDQSEPALDIIGDMQRILEELTENVASSNSGSVTRFIAEAMSQDSREYQNKAVPCIPSGNAWFDAKTGGGYRHGKITLICARPNVGKSPFGLMGVAYNCQRGRKCVIFSLEMEKEEVLRNLIPYVIDVPNIVVNRPDIRTPEQHALIRQGYNIICEWDKNLSIYDEKMDCDQICWTIDRETRNGEEVLFDLDHFRAIAGLNLKRDTREVFNENSSRLTAKIKHKNAALAILLHPRKARNLEEASKPPIPDDIKESGNMYEDCFACLIIHREINAETKKMSTDALLNLAKLRTGGSVGSTTAHFNTRNLAFEAEAELDLEQWYQ